ARVDLAIEEVVLEEGVLEEIQVEVLPLVDLGQNSEVVLQFYCRDFDSVILQQNPRLTDMQVEKEWEKSFAIWLRYRVEQHFITDSRVQEISYGPSKIVRVYPGYIVNGYRFHMIDYGRNKSTMNNGVCMTGNSSGTREFAPSTQFSVDDINEPICLYKDNEEEEADPNAIDDHVVEREVESSEEEEWIDDEDD
ncbi:hypothetical protein Taro_042374, partial [Colocasia esculenta]|nr:hypothetical protein [Colocasia esculenta]